MGKGIIIFLGALVTCLSMQGEEPSFRMEQLKMVEYRPTEQAGDFSGEIEIGKIDTIPDWLRSLHGRSISTRGYMYPLDFERGLTREFLFLPFDLTCYFGDFPQLDEFFIVFVEGEGFRPELHMPSTVSGVLEIRESWESGIPVGLLFLKATGVTYTQ